MSKNKIKNDNGNLITHNDEYNRLNNSDIMTSATFLHYVDYFFNLGVSMFKWEGLPNSIDLRFLEKTLYLNGAVVFFKDSILNELICARFANTNNIDNYGNPKTVTAITRNGATYPNLKVNEDCVICYNSVSRNPSINSINLYAKRLTDIERTIDINIYGQRTPLLFECAEEQLLSLKNVYQKYDDFTPIIFGNKNFSDLNKINCIQTNAPYVSDKLFQHKKRVMNEALTYLGIDNIFEKKERLVTSEAEQTQGETLASREGRLKERKEFAERLNEVLNISNVKCAYNSNVEKMVKEVYDE